MILCSAKRIIALFLVNHVFVGIRSFERKRRLLNAIGYQIGEGTKVVGPIFCTGKLIVGTNCWIGRNLTIHGNGTVIVGKNCDIAPDVTFLTGGHKIGSPERRADVGESYTIRVEDGCWIGARATLLQDICLGKGCVIAACACVAKDVLPNTLAGGVPAKEIKKLNETENDDE